MKVQLVNGSPHRHGCTDRALREVAATLQGEGIEADVFWIGAKPVGGCMGCNGCAKGQGCVIDDVVDEFLPRVAQADGFVFGAPVHFSHAAASLLGFMDRLFYAELRYGGQPGSAFAHKPAAAVVSARRAGTTCSFDDINKFFAIRQMPIVGAQYWNMVHGNMPAEVEQDEEGLGTMRVLGHNMAWLLKCIEAGKEAGLEPARPEPFGPTNFIR